MPITRTKGYVASSTVTTAELLQTLETFSGWLKAFGVRTENTRIHEYKKHLERVLGPKMIPLSESIYYECWELKTIFEGLHNWTNPPQVLIEKLKQLRRGHVFFQRESDRRPRNTAFELQVAAAFRTAGMTPFFENELLEDVGIIFEGRRIHFQCKRIKTEARTRERMIEAADQLARVTDQSAIKVAAIDIVTAGNAQRLSRSSGIDAAQRVDAEIGGWYERHINNSGWFSDHKHVSAVLFRNAALNVRDDGRLQHVAILGLVVWNEHPHSAQIYRVYEALSAASSNKQALEIAI